MLWDEGFLCLNAIVMKIFFFYRAYAENLRNIFSIMPLMIIAVQDLTQKNSYTKELIQAGRRMANDLGADFKVANADFKQQGIK